MALSTYVKHFCFKPIRHLRVELKRYLARHAYLSGETEWVNESRSYGLLKEDKSDVPEVDSGSGKAGASEAATGEIHAQ